MEYLMFFENSLIDFFTLSVFTVVPILIYSKYRFRKQIKLSHFPLSIVVFLALDFFNNVINDVIVSFFSKTRLAYNISSQSIGSVFITFLIILFLQYKGTPIYQAIISMCSIYLVTSLINELFFSNVAININTPIGYGLSLSAITFSSLLLCIAFIKLLDLINEKYDKRIYGFLTSFFFIVFILGINLKPLFFPANSKLKPEVYQQLDMSLNDEMLATDKIVNTDIFLILIVLVLIVLLIIISNIYYKEQKIRFQTQQTKELESYIETIEMIRDEVLSYQHDYDNIFAGISGYIYEDKIDLEKLRNYYEQSAEKIFHNEGIKIIKLLHLKNIKIPEIKGILSQKILQARQKNIYVQLEVTEPMSNLPMDKIDLTRCLGILLDNAIEAASLSEAKQLAIAFILIEKQLVIVIKNSLNTSKKIDDGVFLKKRFTSKKEQEKHGFGLFNVNKILEKYGNIHLKTTISEYDFIQEIRMNLEEENR